MNEIPTSEEVDVEKCIKLIRKAFKGATAKQRLLVIPMEGLSDMEIEWIKTLFMEEVEVSVGHSADGILNKFKDPYEALEFAKRMDNEYLCTEYCFEITKVEKAKYFKVWDSQ